MDDGRCEDGHKDAVKKRYAGGRLIDHERFSYGRSQQDPSCYVEAIMGSKSTQLEILEC